MSKAICSIAVTCMKLYHIMILKKVHILQLDLSVVLLNMSSFCVFMSETTSASNSSFWCSLGSLLVSVQKKPHNILLQ